MKISLVRPAVSAAFLIAAMVLIFAGCRRPFSPFLEKARVSFSEKNYINTIDEINVGLSCWRDSDGLENKGEAYQLLGQSYHRLRNTDKAIEAYRHAMALSDKTYDSAYALGMLSLAKSQTIPALEAFRKALQMKPDDPQALLGLGHGYYAEGQYAAAKQAYQKALDASPGVREALESIELANSKLNTSRPRQPRIKSHRPR